MEQDSNANAAPRPTGPTASALFLRDAEVRHGIEQLFFANIHLWRAIDSELAAADLGRAHFRALYFICRRPALTVGELLTLLNISKQSLGRVLAVLAQRQLIDTRPGSRDRRQRELRPTAAGAAQERALTAAMHDRMAQAYRTAGQDAVTGFWHVARALVPPGDARAIDAILGSGSGEPLNESRQG